MTTADHLDTEVRVRLFGVPDDVDTHRQRPDDVQLTATVQMQAQAARVIVRDPSRAQTVLRIYDLYGHPEHPACPKWLLDALYGCKHTRQVSISATRRANGGH
jgi:hypothetical protein